MQPQSLTIGSRPQESAKSGLRAPIARSKPRLKPPRTIDTYVDKKYIGSIDFWLLWRFSWRTQDAFPKNLTPASGARTHTKASDGIDFKLDVLWEQPSVKAFRFAFDWMAKARSTSSRKEELPLYGVEGSEDLDLYSLVDCYAASLCLDLHPRPIRLKERIYRQLTEVPISVQQLRFIHESVPINDRIITRMLTCFVERRGVQYEWYTKEERMNIEDYIHNEDPELCHQFVAIRKAYNQRQRANQHGRNAPNPRQPSEMSFPSGEDKAHQEISSPAPPVLARLEAPATEMHEANGFSRRSRRNRRGKGLGRDGRKVPGANY